MRLPIAYISILIFITNYSCKQLSYNNSSRERIHTSDYVFFILNEPISGQNQFHYCLTKYGTLSQKLGFDSLRVRKLIMFKDTLVDFEVGDSVIYFDRNRNRTSNNDNSYFVSIIFNKVQLTNQTIDSIEIKKDNIETLPFIGKRIVFEVDYQEDKHKEIFLPMYLKGYVCTSKHESSIIFEKKLSW